MRFCLLLRLFDVITTGSSGPSGLGSLAGAFLFRGADVGFGCCVTNGGSIVDVAADANDDSADDLAEERVTL